MAQIKTKFNIGKKEGSMGMLNSGIWIKTFENGVKIRKKGQGELTFEANDIFEIMIHLRKFGKKFNLPIFLTTLEMIYVWQQYPETKEFIERLLMDEVSDEEKLKIHEDYMRKVNILESLEDKK